MQKKGQLTVFIVIGILILLVTIVIFYVSSVMITEEIQPETGDVDVAPFKLFVEHCLEESMIDAIYLVLSQGGYYELIGADMFNFPDEEIFLLPYYFSKKETKIPDLKIIELETETAAATLFTECTEAFQAFEEQGYQIVEGKAEVDLEFNERFTRANLHLPLQINKGNRSVSLDTFSAQVDISIPKKYKLISTYFTEQEKEPNSFLFGDFSLLAFDHNFSFWFDQYQEDGSDIVVSLAFDENVREEPLIYSFALNYDWSELDTTEKEEIDFEPLLFMEKIPEWNITEAGIHQYWIISSGYGINFSVDTTDLNIDENGLITLNTENFENDEYWYFVTATDIFNESVSGPLYINIKIDGENIPKLQEISDQQARVGEEFIYKVIAENPAGGPLLYTSESYLFDINKKTGMINFTPSADNIGINSIRVDVENQYGKIWERFDLEIK